MGWKSRETQAALKNPPELRSKWTVTPELYRTILSMILALGFVTKVFHLSFPPDFYFDETYHGYTATQYLHGNKDAYDPWAKNPPGKANEWTHPPLAKLIMTGMMQTTGENSFGWRIGSVVFGTISVALLAALTLELFQSPLIALLAAFFMSVEGLVFVQSRIAMNDIYFVCFTLFTVLSYYRWRKSDFQSRHVYLVGLGLGLAASTKWTALYLFGILGVDLIIEALTDHLFLRKIRWLPAIVSFGVIPVALYIASYAQFFYLGWDWARFIEVQKQMWGYHSNLKATHDYGSKPWQWVFNIRPVWMHVVYPGPGRIANIYNLGNSVVLLSGLFAAYYTLFKEKLVAPQFMAARRLVLLCYFLLWAPWIISPRVMLFYHYTPAVPFLCILLARFVNRLWLEPTPAASRWAYGITGGALLWFVVFYPNSTDITVPAAWANAVYFAIPGWK